MWGSAMSVREKLEKVLGRLDTEDPHAGEACTMMEAAIHDALSELEELERDHEAMETLRFASLRRGFKWLWDGMDLLQTSDPTVSKRYKDPADAILGQRPTPVEETP